MGETATILLVDDERRQGAPLQAALTASGYRVTAVSTIVEAIEAVAMAVPDLILIAAQPVPFVLVGQDPAPSTQERSRAAGSPPWPDPEAVVEEVRRRLEEARRDRSRGGPGPIPGLPAPSARNYVLSRLNSAAVRIQEEERRKLSLELHDGIAQLLGNLVLMMGTCLAVAPEGAEDLRRYLRQARDTAREGFRRVQGFSIDLRPPMLDDLGLAPTILWYAERFTQENGIPVEVSMPDRLPHLTGEQETALFRILQQALQNVRQHAHARRVEVTLDARAGWLRLAIADDGVGIGGREIERKLAEGTHLGVAGMRYRAELLGGKLELLGAAGEGTTVVAEIPIEHGPLALEESPAAPGDPSAAPPRGSHRGAEVDGSH